MRGREVIPVTRRLSLDELEQFMRQHWNQEEYGTFRKGKPTPASIEEYILLPATERTMVIVYPRGGGIFSKGDKVVVTVCDSPEGAALLAASAIPVKNAFFRIAQTVHVVKRSKEFKGEAADMVEAYATYLRTLLEEAGLAG